jgi:hypothetical protein
MFTNDPKEDILCVGESQNRSQTGSCVSHANKFSSQSLGTCDEPKVEIVQVHQGTYISANKYITLQCVASDSAVAHFIFHAH